MSVMRSSLIGSLLQVLKFNLDRRADRVRLFEVGRVFLRDATVATTDSTVAGIHQPMRVAGLIYGRSDALQWGVKGSDTKNGMADFYDAKGDVEAMLAPLQAEFEAAEHPAMHPGRCAKVSVQGQAIGFVGELHPRWRQGYELPQAPQLFELDLSAVLARQVPVASLVSKFQAVQRDLAVIVAETVTYSKLIATISEAPGAMGLLSDMLLFDVFRPPGTTISSSEGGLVQGEKSLAVRITLNSDASTLTEAQIEAAMQSIIHSMGEHLGARLR
jgi:phenylalanyl-tRNA synthetase beta chain